jgi:hypothetical protein
MQYREVAEQWPMTCSPTGSPSTKPQGIEHAGFLVN